MTFLGSKIKFGALAVFWPRFHRYQPNLRPISADSQPIMVARRPRRVVEEEPLGSHTSEAEMAPIAAEQADLLAAAASGSRTNASGKKRSNLGVSADAGIKKKISFKKLVTTSPTKSDSRRSRNEAISKAVYSLARAKFQKGDRKDELTGAVYFRGKPRYKQNNIFKEKLQLILGEEPLRWNDEWKLYSAKLYNDLQAMKIFKAMKEISIESESDLTAEWAVRDIAKYISDTFDFPEANDYTIKSFPLTVNTTEMHAFGGATYFFRKALKEEYGFEFKNSVNEMDGVQLWLGSPSKVEEVEELFKEYGFPVEKFDGIETDDEDDEDEA